MLYYVAVDTTRGTVYLTADGTPSIHKSHAMRFDVEYLATLAIDRIPERLRHAASVQSESVLDTIISAD